MASSFTVLADLKAVCCLKTGRCSTSAEIRLLRFLRLFNRDDVDLFGIDDAVAKLGVERWRIYDVVNILESVGVLSRKGKSLYSWKGFVQILRSLHQLKKNVRERVLAS
ncbi:E2F transcription factor-like E2FF [Brassica napus]|uniref:E2F transcription factor-like E2FF n=1 Tax=Brassica napus TaxID=3708 RepID=UPI0020797B6A|nr:E2F transcription factor-like E2FF [Brassica napus]